MRSHLLKLFLLMVPVALASPVVQGQQVGNSILINQAVRQDLYLAGRNIDITADVDGDVIAAGRRVTIAGRVGEDVTVAGEDILIPGSLQDDLRAGGRIVELTGSVGGHVMAAGQRVNIGPESDVGDWAWLAGETIDINGKVNGEVKAAGRNIVINGEILDDVELMGRELRLGPNAVIRGDLSWRSPNPLDRSSGARVEGRVTEIQGSMGRSRNGDWFEEKGRGIGSYLYSVLSMAAGSIVLYLLLPVYSRKATDLLRAEPWNSLGTGFAVLLITPVVCLFLFVTLIGLLPGLVLMGFYFGFLVFGLLMGIITAAGFGLRQAGKYAAATQRSWAAAILAASVVLVLLWEIPLVGGLLFILVWIFGLGAAGLGLFRMYTLPRAVPAQTPAK